MEGGNVTGYRLGYALQCKLAFIATWSGLGN